MNEVNPFEYLGANDLTDRQIADYYIEDFNYSRFIQSKRNILLVGERGSGKSMTLLYNSFGVKAFKNQSDGKDLSVDWLGIYVACNTPLIHKPEFQIVDEFQAQVISEHHLSLSVAYHIAATINQIPNHEEGAVIAEIKSRLEYILGVQLPEANGLFESLMTFVDRESVNIQKYVNQRGFESTKDQNTYSFTSLVLPILRSATQLPSLRNSHFMLLIDDAHDLNDHQVKVLNSWIAYRDHSLFSFKVAIANISKHSLKTFGKGSIHNGHDFTRIDMIQQIQSETSDFGRFAHRIVSRRLSKQGINKSPEEFFPVSQNLQKQLDKVSDRVRQEAIKKYGPDEPKKIADYVYKYARALYFRSRSRKANRNEYSGFSMLTYISTGVVRNLLSPCYWMYDKQLSQKRAKNDTDPIQEIPASEQNGVIIDKSRELWDFIRNDLARSIEKCSTKDGTHAYQLMDNLAIHFRERLLHHKSEPRANSFTISASQTTTKKLLDHVLTILREALIIYVRSGPSKDKGKRENYYIPNRMLWPERGLDPHGQHARVSLKEEDLWLAASQNKPIPFSMNDNTKTSDQGDFLDEL